MEWEEYKRLPRIAQEALIAINDEEAFEIKCPDEINIVRKNVIILPTIMKWQII